MCKNEEVTVDGIVDAIVLVKRGPKAYSAGSFDGVSVDPAQRSSACPISRTAEYQYSVSALIIDVAMENRSGHVIVPVKDIVSVGEIKSVDQNVTPDTGVADALTNAEDGSTIYLAAGEYTAAMSVSAAVSLIGPNDVDQTQSVVKEDTTLPGAVLKGAVTVNKEDGTVVFRGISFDSTGVVTVSAAKRVSFINCMFKNAKEDAVSASTDTRVIYSGCTFLTEDSGDEPTTHTDPENPDDTPSE